MGNFKIGDTVERVVAGSGGLRVGERGIVTGVGFGYVLIAGKDSWKHTLESLQLVEEQDDPLPPAPDSVLYVNTYKWGIKVNNLGDELHVGVGDPNTEHGWTYASLDADTALQLCHDLRRMAMEIKRKEKQDVI